MATFNGAHSHLAHLRQILQFCLEPRSTGFNNPTGQFSKFFRSSPETPTCMCTWCVSLHVVCVSVAYVSLSAVCVCAVYVSECGVCVCMCMLCLSMVCVCGV